MSMWEALREILTPGQDQFKARVLSVTEEQARLLQTLHMLESPGMSELRAATDDAARF